MKAERWRYGVRVVLGCNGVRGLGTCTCTCVILQTDRVWVKELKITHPGENEINFSVLPLFNQGDRVRVVLLLPLQALLAPT